MTDPADILLKLPASHLIALDVLLTGRPVGACRQNAKAQAHRFEGVMTLIGEYYLADGGYSRLWITEEGHVFLGQNSLAGPKARWNAPDVQARVAQLSSWVIREINRLSQA